MRNRKSYINRTIILLFLFIAGLSAQVNNQSKFNTARKLLADGQFDKSEKLFQELINSDKNNWMYISSLNLLYLRKKEYGKSIKLLKERITEKPSDITAICELGTTYYTKKDMDSAFVFWDKAFEVAGSNHTYISMVVNYPVRYRCYDKAIDYLTEGRKRVSDPSVFLHQLGNVYVAMSDFENAMKVYCELLEKNPKRLSLAQSAVRRMFYSNRVNPVIGEIILEKYEDSGKIEFLDLLKEFYLLGSEYQKLKETSLKIFEVNKSIEQVYSIAVRLQNEKEYELAAELYTKIVESPGEKQIKINSKIKILDIRKKEVEREKIPEKEKKEQYLIVKNDFEEILKNLKFKSLEPELLFKIAELQLLSKGEYTGYFSLSKNYGFNKFALLSNIKIAEYYTHKDNLDSAFLFLNKTLRNKQINPKLKNELEFKIVKNLFWRHKFIETAKQISELSHNFQNLKSNEMVELSLLLSIAKKDSSDLVKYAKADFYRHLGKNEEAVDLFKKVSLNDNLFGLNFYAAIQLAEIKNEEKKYNESIEILDQLVEKEKVSPFYDKALYLQGMIFHYGLGDLTKAVEIYSNVIKKYPDSVYLDECRKNIMLIKKSK